MPLVRIALPNKGRLSESALTLLRKAGLRARMRSDRSLIAPLGDGFQGIFLRAADIPEFVADGAADIGVTGADLVVESGREVRELLDLEFGQCRLVVAVQDASAIQGLSDIAAGTRVATAFPRLTRSYFESHGIPVEIATVSGATEIAPHLGVAEIIVDLSSTGSTLRVNGMREVETVMRSSARLIAGERVLAQADFQNRISELCLALESVRLAREKRYLMANVPRDRLDEVKDIIPGISGPTIVELLGGGPWVAAHAVVDADCLSHTIPRLKALGAEGILVTAIERLMP